MHGNCDCACPDPLISEVPGSPGNDGDDGADGTDGINAFAFTTADFDVPATGANETVLLSTSAWMTVGQNVFIEDAGYFEVVSFPGTTSAVLKYLDYPGNTHTGETIATNSQVSPAGIMPVITGVTALTDNSTGTASDTIAAGVGVFTLAFPIQLASMTTVAADLLTNYIMGFAFKILSISFVTTTISTGAGASQVLNLEIGTTNLTGGLLTVTLGGTDTLGELTAATAITAANTGSATDTLSIEVAAGGTVFTAGDGIILVKVQNMDDAGAVASLADHVNDLISQLT